MTIEEIRSELQKRGMTQKELAAMLHVHPVTLGLILIGKNKLTEQLAAHIELLFDNMRQNDPVEHTLTLPETVVERWMPSFRTLPESQRSAAILDVIHKAVHWLICEGEKQFTPQELANIRAFCEAQSTPPAPTPYTQDDEEPLLSAADGNEG